MIIRWQSKSRLAGSFQQINAVVRAIPAAVIITAGLSFGVKALIDSAGLGVAGLISETGAGVSGEIAGDSFGVTGLINNRGNGVEGEM